MESVRDLSRCNSQSDLKERIPPHTGSAGPSLRPALQQRSSSPRPPSPPSPFSSHHLRLPFPSFSRPPRPPSPSSSSPPRPSSPFLSSSPRFPSNRGTLSTKRQCCERCLEDTSPGNCIPGLSRNCMLDSFCRTDRVGHVYSLSAEKKEYKQGRTLSTYTRSHQSLFPSPIQVLGKGAASRRQPRRTGY